MRTRRLKGSPRGIVLLYHRVAALQTDPWELAVSPTRFSEQMDAIRSEFDPQPLAALIARSSNGHGRSVAVTFDDGYRDNLFAAKPILERYAVPGTVFVVTGHIDRDEPFWWDRLVHICATAHRRPERIELSADGQRISCDAASMGLEKTCRALGRRLRGMPERTRDRFVELLRDEMSVRDDPPGYAMTAQMLCALDGDLVEVGAHTATHPPLSLLPRASQIEELRDSKVRLEEILDRHVRCASYPFGDSSRTTRRCARELGFAWACGTTAGPLSRRTDRYDIPRVFVGDWSADRLLEHIAELLA